MCLDWNECARPEKPAPGFIMKSLYKTARWQRLRKAQLAAHPYCQCPHHDGKGLHADHPDFGGAVVDHKKKHKGDPKLFFDRRNLQTMTKHCHDKFKQSEEKGGAGFLKGCDVNGWPLDRSHEWHASGS